MNLDPNRSQPGVVVNTDNGCVKIVAHVAAANAETACGEMLFSYHPPSR